MGCLYFDDLRWRAFLASFNAKEEQSQWNWFSKVLDIGNYKTDILNLAQRMSASSDSALPQNSSVSPLLYNLKFIYGNTYGSNWGVVKAYRDTREKIVEQYICIRGMEQLFDEIYFQFEWNMHVTPDFVKGNESLYRDHFLHQSKNAWMGYVFLQRVGWMKYCIDWLNSAQNKKIAMYVNRAIEEEMIRQKTADRATADHPLNQLLSIYVMALNKRTKGKDRGQEKNIVEEVLCEAIEWNSKTLTFQGKKDAVLRALIRFNLIKTTWFIAALLHDIGYPLSHFHTSLKQIAHFIPSMEWQDPTDIRSFEHYKCRLKNSLLFKVIDEDTLKNEFTDNIHGTLSAIMMLNHFYEQGTVHTFSPLQQCAVDWAAVCIQQHTQKFQASTLDPKEKYSMDRISNNPLGYLLRLVDDLQEYGRFYFQIDGCHTVLFCPKCGYPMKSMSDFHGVHGDKSNDEDLLAQMDIGYVKKEDCEDKKKAEKKECEDKKKVEDKECEDKKKAEEEERKDGVLVHSCFNKDIRRRYYCACPECTPIELTDDDELIWDRQLVQCRTFDSRRINTIRFCNQVVVQTGDTLMHLGEPVRITLRYDPWAMLELTRMNPRFLQGRIAPNNEIKRMLLRQSELPQYLLYFMISINPVLLKTEILYEYILNHHFNEWEDIRRSFESWMSAAQEGCKLSQKIRSSIGSYELESGLQGESDKLQNLREEIEDTINLPIDTDEASNLEQYLKQIRMALNEKKSVSQLKVYCEQMMEATQAAENEMMERAVQDCFEKVLQAIQGICLQIVQEKIGRTVTLKGYANIEEAADMHGDPDQAQNLKSEWGKRMVLLAQFFYAPVLVLYAYAYWWIMKKEDQPGELLTQLRTFLDLLDKDIGKCYNHYIVLLQQRIGTIKACDDGRHDKPSESVYFLMQDALRYRKCIAYHLMDLHKLYSREACIAGDDKTYLHSFESCTDPTKALKEDLEAIAYEEKLIQHVQNYTDMNGYDPGLVYARDTDGKRNRQYLIADFYGDLRLFYVLYIDNNYHETIKDEAVFDGSRCNPSSSSGREV